MFFILSLLMLLTIPQEPGVQETDLRSVLQRPDETEELRFLKNFRNDIAKNHDEERRFLRDVLSQISDQRAAIKRNDDALQQANQGVGAVREGLRLLTQLVWALFALVGLLAVIATVVVLWKKAGEFYQYVRVFFS